MDSEKMGRFIADQRKAKGLTQRELADRLHITDKAVSKWERGLSSPDIMLLPPLADALGVSVNALLRGEKANEPLENKEVGEVLHYAESSVKKKYSAIKTVFALCFVAVLLLGLVVCAIVDVAIHNAFTWSLYSTGSILFAGCVLFPMIYSGRKGIIPALVALTVLILPYLLALDRLSAADGLVFRLGGIVSILSVVYLWSVLLIVKAAKSRKWIGAGISTMLAGPLSVLINFSLSRILTPEAAAFDVWDVLGLVILIAAGFGMICFDLIVKRTSIGVK